MKKENPYYLLLEGLLKDLRLTANGFQVKYDIRSFSTIMNKLKTEPTKRLHPETIGKIESALNIKIDDSNLEKITYKKINKPIFDDTVPTFEYPVLSEVYAGEPEKIDIEFTGVKESFTYFRRSHNCFALRVNGSSMETTLSDGDIVLVDMDLLPIDGDLVAVKLQNGNQYIKRYYKFNDYIIKLTSDNPEYGVRMIDTKDVVAIHPIVSINFNIRNGERKGYNNSRSN